MSCAAGAVCSLASAFSSGWIQRAFLISSKWGVAMSFNLVSGADALAVLFCLFRQAACKRLKYLTLQELGCVPDVQAYLYSGELFPTSVRNTVLGFCSQLGHLGGIVAPAVIYLGIHSPVYTSAVCINCVDPIRLDAVQTRTEDKFVHVHTSTGTRTTPVMPYIIFGTCTFLAGLAAAMLPETLGEHQSEF